MASGSASASTTRPLPRINRVDVPTPLVLSERGQLLRLFVHPDVPMRNHFISKVDVSGSVHHRFSCAARAFPS